VVLLGAGTYEGPVTVPDGVTLRGLGPERTVVRSERQGPAVVLGRRSRLEHVRVDTTIERIAWLPVVVVACAGAGAVVAGSVVTGTIGVSADDVRLAAVRAWGVTAEDVERLSVVRSAFEGMRWDVGIDVRRGAGHLIDSCELTGHLCAVHLTATVSATVRRCSIAARWWGVRLSDTEATSVTATVVRGTMRAVDVDGGTTIDVIGNAAIDGDSGLLVQRGAHGVHARGNYWERCRVGLFTWESPDVHHHDNAAVDLWEPDAAAVIGPV
jgi:alpha-L-fucosidase